ncbi:MAG: hypothetical protein M4579_003439 [Chaenotheca gracillima]|nr:MAG: hypothetical protein M4579_003439 [Chaenotheca gracillima]
MASNRHNSNGYASIHGDDLGEAPPYYDQSPPVMPAHRASYNSPPGPTPRASYQSLNMQNPDAAYQSPPMQSPPTQGYSTQSPPIASPHNSSQYPPQMPSHQSSYSSYHSYESTEKPVFSTRSFSQSTLFEPSREVNPPTIPGVDFSRNKQLARLLGRGLWRWFISFGLMVGTLATLLVYCRFDVMEDRTRRVFNTIVTGLALALGLNIASALKDQMMALRWRILSNRSHSLRVADLLLRADSVTNLLKVIFTWEVNFFLRMGLISWVLLNIAAQVGVATISLTYQLDNFDSTSSWRLGKVLVPDLTKFSYIGGGLGSENGTNQFFSHSYGDLAISYAAAPVADMKNDTTSLYFWDDTLTTFTYRFHDTLPEDQSKYTITNRILTSTSSCMSYPVLSGDDGLSTAIAFEEDGTRQDVDMLLGGEASVVYALPAQAAFGFCGPRCTQIWAFQSIDPMSSDKSAHFYKCNVTVGTVSNTYAPEHQLPPEIAQLMAGAIGISGYSTLSNANSSGYPELESNRYLAGSWWGSPFSNDASGMERITAQFAIGVMTVMGEVNDKVTIDNGHRPKTGVRLTIKWDQTGLCLGILLLGQLLVFIVVTLISNMVIVRDESALSLARILRPFVEPLGYNGCNLSGGKIAKQFTGGKVIYGTRRISGDLYHLEIAPPDETLKPQQWFPEGVYNGTLARMS